MVKRKGNVHRKSNYRKKNPIRRTTVKRIAKIARRVLYKDTEYKIVDRISRIKYTGNANTYGTSYWNSAASGRRTTAYTMAIDPKFSVQQDENTRWFKQGLEYNAERGAPYAMTSNRNSYGSWDGTYNEPVPMVNGNKIKRIMFALRLTCYHDIYNVFKNQQLYPTDRDDAKNKVSRVRVVLWRAKKGAKEDEVIKNMNNTEIQSFLPREQIVKMYDKTYTINNVRVIKIMKKGKQGSQNINFYNTANADFASTLNYNPLFMTLFLEERIWFPADYSEITDTVLSTPDVKINIRLWYKDL